MADWYVSSVAYTAVAQYANLHSYSIGDIVRQLAAPAVGSERCFRCTTAGVSGASEAAWTNTHGATTTQGTAVFTEVTGNSTYNWSAPHARLGNAVTVGGTWAAAGDRVFLSSDHAETQASAISIVSPSAATSNPPLCYSVNKAGSVPPVAADLTPGASITTTGANGLSTSNGIYLEGTTLNCGTGSSGAILALCNNSSQSLVVLKNCALNIVHTAAGAWLSITGSNARHLWDNVTISFGGTGQGLAPAGGAFWEWRNTASAIQGATLPTQLMGTTSNYSALWHDVDLSALGSGKTLCPAQGNNRLVLDSCKLGASVTIASSLSGAAYNQTIDVRNCDSGATGYRNEWYRREGTITTETTITRTGGASDSHQAVSWKAISTSTVSLLDTFDFPPIVQWNDTTGSSKTATIEIVGSASLNNDDLWVELDYLGSSGSPLGSLVSSNKATLLTASAAITTSTAAWASSPATPVYQKLQVTFTPQIAGLVVARVKLAKASTTVYVDPLITIV